MEVRSKLRVVLKLFVLAVVIATAIHYANIYRLRYTKEHRRTCLMTNQSTLEGALELLRMERKSEFENICKTMPLDQNMMKQIGYLKYSCLCPDGGIYSVSVNDFASDTASIDLSCSVHGPKPHYQWVD